MKNAKIAHSMKLTKEKRKFQECKVFELKIVSNKLNKVQKDHLKMLFIEAKRLRNDIIANDIFDYVLNNTVTIKKQDQSFEKYELKYLGSQMKQSILQQVINDCRALKALKLKGHFIGRLKFVSEVNSIDLKQHKTSYQINGNRAKIQKVPGRVYVKGYEQLKGYELANAKIIQKPSGYYLKVTSFREKTIRKTTPSVIGIDMGVKTHITTSNGEKFNILIEEPKRLKSLQRKFAKQEKGSNNQYKTKQKIKKLYEKHTNVKNDKANKLCHELLKHQIVIFQDEMISQWKIMFGKQIHHSILGRVKDKLSPGYKLDKSLATTQYCFMCENKTKHNLSKRTYVCNFCNHTDDRDIHAAKNMIFLANKNIAMEHSDFKLVELTCLAMKQEATSLLD